MAYLPDVRKSVVRRLARLDRVNASQELRHLELALCAKDVVHWVNNWAWTYDPRRTPTFIPFDLFPRQEELLRWLQEREFRKEDGLVEKSRDSGLTYLCASPMGKSELPSEGRVRGLTLYSFSLKSFLAG